MPDLVAHCDWGSQPSKRWIAMATRRNGVYTAYAPQPVGEMETLLHRLRKQASKDAAILVGFDFPLGLPKAYAELAGIDSFPAFLRDITHTQDGSQNSSQNRPPNRSPNKSQDGSGKSRWSHFHEVCASEEEITVERPFYPARPGGARRDAIHEALGLANRNLLYRECELRHAERTNACSLFWTLGGNQVGKSALIGWRSVVGPELHRRPESMRLWPFDGELKALIQPGVTIAVETYPTEYHRRIFGQALRGKRYAVKRREIAPAWLETAHRCGIRIDRKLRRQILNGFTESSVQDADQRDENDDAMDAAIGLFGMLAALHDYDSRMEPRDETIRRVEGWILGLEHPLPGA